MSLDNLSIPLRTHLGRTPHLALAHCHLVGTGAPLWRRRALPPSLLLWNRCCTSGGYIYIDDLLMAHPAFSAFIGAYACHLLQVAGFIVSPKSVLAPSPSITWLGKHIDAHSGITNLPSRQAQVLLAIWALRTVSCSSRSLQRVLGSLQWLACLHSLIGPWPAPLYQFLFNARCDDVLPLRQWCFLLTTFLLTLVPVNPRPVPPPATMPPLFIDAAPCGNSFIVACHRPHSSATVVQTPDWVATQQDAELYGAFHAVCQCALRGLSHFCMYTDNIGVYYTLTTGGVAASSPVRARICRRFLRTCLAHSLQLQVGWVKGACNSADMFSRPFEFSSGHCLLASLCFQLPSSVAATPTTIVPLLWFRSFPSRC